MPSTVEIMSSEEEISLLTRMVDLISKSNHKPDGLSPLSASEDPNPAIGCCEIALMKMLASFRRSASSMTYKETDWTLVDKVFGIIYRQQPLPPSYVIYCWITHWQRLCEVVETWLTNVR